MASPNLGSPEDEPRDRLGCNAGRTGLRPSSPLLRLGKFRLRVPLSGLSLLRSTARKSVRYTRSRLRRRGAAPL